MNHLRSVLVLIWIVTRMAFTGVIPYPHGWWNDWWKCHREWRLRYPPPLFVPFVTSPAVSQLNIYCIIYIYIYTIYKYISNGSIYLIYWYWLLLFIFYIYIYKYTVGLKMPFSMDPEYQAAQRAYMRYHNMNPIFGISSKYVYITYIYIWFILWDCGIWQLFCRLFCTVNSICDSHMEWIKYTVWIDDDDDDVNYVKSKEFLTHSFLFSLYK